MYRRDQTREIISNGDGGDGAAAVAAAAAVSPLAESCREDTGRGSVDA